MGIVVDLGCATYSNADSLTTLAEKYRPVHIYGFDPRLDEDVTEVAGIPATLSRLAAWTHDGEVGFADTGGWEAHISESAIPVPCFDFSRWLYELGETVILKMDIEGAEIPILRRMYEDGTDNLVEELIVEWHYDAVLPPLRCPITEWWM